MKLKIFFLTLLCLIIIQSTYAQKELMAGDKFHSAIQKAEKISNIFPRSHIIKEISYKNGEILKTVDFLWEADSTENYRIVRTETIDDKIEKIEEIKIGLYTYKRENDGNWTKENRRFSDSLVTEDSALLGCWEFSKELIGENQNASSFNSFQIGQDSNGLNYTEENYLINEVGRIVKKEVFKGQLNPRNIKWHQIFTYNYDKDLKIEAPIK